MTIAWYYVTRNSSPKGWAQTLAISGLLIFAACFDALLLIRLTYIP